MQVKERVFILKKTKYGDSDLIVNCLTPRGARISLYARSALKSKKRFGGGVLEPTHYVQALYEDKSGSSPAENPLHTLKEASIIESFSGLRTDYTRIEAGLHFVQLISAVVREGDMDSAELFNLLGNSLRAAEKSSKIDLLRLAFEIKLLSNQGVLQVDEDEASILRLSIADHESIRLSDRSIVELRIRLKQVFRDYLQHPVQNSD